MSGKRVSESSRLSDGLSRGSKRNLNSPHSSSSSSSSSTRAHFAQEGDEDPQLEYEDPVPDTYLEEHVVGEDFSAAMEEVMAQQAIERAATGAAPEGVVEVDVDEAQIADAMRSSRRVSRGADGQQKRVGFAAEEDEEGEDEAGHADGQGPQVWRPGLGELAEDEELVYAPEAYRVYHQLQLDWSCLTFDVLRDSLGMVRDKFPATLYMVTGSQAAPGEQNVVTVLRVRDLHQERAEEDDEDDAVDLEDDAEGDEDLDQDPIVDGHSFAHPGAVTRLRCMPQQPDVVATWSDEGVVFVWNIADYVRAIDLEQAPPAASPAPVQALPHGAEGWALAWSPVARGLLATGDRDGLIRVWQPTEDGAHWAAEPMLFAGHTGSVECIQWSPNEPTVFISSSSDGTIRVWETRMEPSEVTLPNGQRVLAVRPQGTLRAHSTDVNVVAWNTLETHLVATGADDGEIKVWSLEVLQKRLEELVEQGVPPESLWECDIQIPHVACYTWHRDQHQAQLARRAAAGAAKPLPLPSITSIEWHPQQSSLFAAASGDDSISVWDLSLEEDVDEVARGRAGASMGDFVVPAQLLFEHRGQRDIKELHFHPQIRSLLLSTALDGMNLFKPANLDVILPPEAEGQQEGAEGTAEPVPVD